MVAAGCLVQWYEIEMFEEYLDSLKLSIGNLKDNVIIDMCLVTNQELETSTKDLNEIKQKFIDVCTKLEDEGF